jgi:hypothetical protein
MCISELAVEFILNSGTHIKLFNNNDRLASKNYTPMVSRIGKEDGVSFQNVLTDEIEQGIYGITSMKLKLS